MDCSIYSIDIKNRFCKLSIENSDRIIIPFNYLRDNGHFIISSDTLTISEESIIDFLKSSSVIGMTDST